jgi:SAM-dependent methyltransferase
MSEGIKENRLVDASVLSDAGRLPFAAETFDIVFSRYLWEHLEHPRAVFAEMARVLKPGGKLVLLTPNRFHYVALISRITSHAVHRKLSVLRGNQPEDTFPTFYRSNTRRDLERLAPADLRLTQFIGREVRPNYLAWSLPAFLLGVLYERLVNRFEFLSPLRVTLVAVFSREN